jgi:hypothetical protein
MKIQRSPTTIVGHKALPPVPRRSSDDKITSLLNEIKSVNGPPRIPLRKSGDAKISPVLLKEIKSIKQGPPRIPLRKRGDESLDNDKISSLMKEIKSINGPPRIPVRKSGDAMVDRRASPPRIPSRKPDRESEECFQ